jgi:CheY-like chemotaxis protein
MSFLVLVVDDEPDVEMLFRQQFRRDLRDNRFTMDFAQSAASALRRISEAAGEIADSESCLTSTCPE